MAEQKTPPKAEPGYPPAPRPGERPSTLYVMVPTGEYMYVSAWTSEHDPELRTKRFRWDDTVEMKLVNNHIDMELTGEVARPGWVPVDGLEWSHRGRKTWGLDRTSQGPKSYRQRDTRTKKLEQRCDALEEQVTELIEQVVTLTDRLDGLIGSVEGHIQGHP